MPYDVILSSFGNIRLTFKQFSTLRLLYKRSKQKCSDPSDDKDSELFKGAPKLDAAGMKDYIGIVPEHVMFLHFLGFVDPLAPDLNPIKNDGKTKTYAITPFGIMFYIYYREKILLDYFPLIISTISLILSILSFVF